MPNLTEKIKTFPSTPGVYLMKNAHKKVIYIGKARSLRNRVANYFGKGRDSRLQIDALMKQVRDIEYIVTTSEKEALLLEYNLIQEYKPHYNVFFKDDKNYTSIKLGSYHKFPGLYLTRKTIQDGSTYFGPYTSSVAAREMIELIIRYFKLRTCKDASFSNRSRPCIQYDMKRCLGPCTALIDEDQYAKQIESAKKFLRGEVSPLIKDLKGEMELASKELRYEDAAHLRNTINSIKQMMEPQSVSDYRRLSKDYIGFYREDERCTLAVLEMRQGRISDYRYVHLIDQLNDNGSVMEQFLIQYYKRAEGSPSEIWVGAKVPSKRALEELLTEIKKQKILIRLSGIGPDAKRLTMANTNAKEMFGQKFGRNRWSSIAHVLVKKLWLSLDPNSIECVDISNISGVHAVGSIVAFDKGLPNKNNYRIFKIRTKDTPDDYTMMKEALYRRFLSSHKPELLLIDGGKGQLMIAQKVLSDLNVENIALVAIAKGKDRKQDQIFLPGRKNPVKFKANDDAYLFLKRVRDEAHRFGISRYRKKHRRESVSSALDSIPGIGPAKRKILLTKFGGIEFLKRASLEELANTPGITRSLAEKIIAHLKD